MNRLKLQLALDFIDIPGAVGIVGELRDDIDIVEVGTPFVISEGLHAVRAIHEAYPGLPILADLKIMDAGEYEALEAYRAGASIVTVLGAAGNNTIQAVIKCARNHGKQVMVDMINVDDIAGRAAQVDMFGADYVCVHTAFDSQDGTRNPLVDLKIVKRVVQNARTAVAGGINTDTAALIAEQQPDIVIAGGSITGQEDKPAAVKRLRESLKL